MWDSPLKHEIDVTEILPTQNKCLGVGKVPIPVRMHSWLV